MSQKIKTSVEIDGSLSASQIANATIDTDKFLVSDGGVIKYRTGAELATDLGVSAGTTSKVQHQVKAGVAINKGQAVYVTGADGTNMIVGLASNATEATSSKTMGLLNATVNINDFADVITEGLLDGLDTSSAVAGNPVWLGTGGNLIYGLANKPYAPSHLVFIGIVTRVNANNGEIFVKIQNGFELNEIHDVDLKTTTPINGHLLGFNGTLWVNKTIAGWLGYTPQAQLNGTGFVKALGTTITYDNTSYYPASNPNGYISTYTETDTLASVTGRGASTSTLSTFDGGLNIGSAKLRWGGSTTPTLGLPFSGSANAFWIDVNDGDTGGLMVDNEGVTVYGAGDNGYVFRVIDEDVYQATTNVASSTTFQINQGQNGGGSIKGNFDISGNLSASGYNKTNWDTAFGWGNHSGLYLGINSKAADSELLDGIDSTRVIFGDNSTGTISISDATLNGALKSGFYTVGTGGIPNATSVNFVLHTAYNGVGNAAGFDLACNDSTTSSFYLRPATGGGKGSWQTIVTSANVGSYAVPSSRTITINGTSYDLSANRSWTVTASETDTLATVTARGALSTGNMFTPVNGGLFFNGNGLYNTGVYGNGNDLWFNAGSTQKAALNSSGDFTANNSLRSPILYDSNDTAYYVDPASTSNISKLRITSAGNSSGGNILMGPAGEGTSKWSYLTGTHYNATSEAKGVSIIGLYTNSTGNTISIGGAIYEANPATQIDFYTHNAITHSTGGTRRMYIDSGGNVVAASNMQAPIFYDSNNTGYYVDPASTSNLNLLTMANKITVGSFPNSTTNNGEAWLGRAADRPSGTMTVQLGGNLDRKFEVVDYGWTTVNFSVNGYGAAEASGSMRAPIFYDSNNTGFYVDPASTTKLNALTLSSLASDDGMIENNTGGYFHLGGWGVGRTAATAILVNTAYRADIADNATYATSAGNSDTVDGFHGDTFFRNLGFGSGYPSWNANTIDESRSGFTYANGAPHNGCIAHFGASGYGIQLNGNYNGDTFSMRSRNGDNGTWRPWKTLYTDYNMDAPNKSGTSYYQTNTWMQFNGAYGLYWPNNNGTHIHSNDSSSYGQVRLQGSKNTYGGIYDTHSGVNGFMYDSAGNGGIYREANGRWFLYHHVGNNCTGISTSSTSGSYRAYIGGSLYAEGDIVAYSDRRKKENIVTVYNALDKVNKLRGVYYNRIDDYSKKRQIGVIAQEIQEVLPEVVTYAEDVDEYGVSYGNITGLLIEAIKEQQKQIEELKELVKTLTNK